MKTKNNNEANKDTMKIVLIGLDNSGKTSILKCLKGIKRISAFNFPMPTKGLDVQDFEALNSKYTIWDLGGQEMYIDDYLKDFEKYIKRASKIIYVIDIQDVNRYEIALEYMKNVINSIDIETYIEFSIFLHKFDPDLVFDQNLNEKVIDDFVKKIKDITPPKFINSIYKTSIFAVFEKSTIS